MNKIRGTFLFTTLLCYMNAHGVEIFGIDLETHGSVFPHIFSTGYRELWGPGISFVEAVVQAADGESS